jgi:4-hydroxybenzoyl-CoA thioesterase
MMRGADLILECDEVRIFAGRREDGTIKALEIPQAIKSLCE